MKFRISLLFLFFSLTAKSQFGLDDTIYKETIKLRLTDNDTIIHLGLPPFQGIYKDSLPGICMVPVFSIEYLIYKTNNKAYARKYVDHCNDSCSDVRVSISSPLEVDAQEIFAIVRNSLSSIRNEEVKPYIYKMYDSSIKLETFDELISPHYARYLIAIYTLKEEVAKSFYSIGFEQKVRRFPLNLNYQSNSRTKTKILFESISDYINKLDKLFVFK